MTKWVKYVSHIMGWYCRRLCEAATLKGLDDYAQIWVSMNDPTIITYEKYADKIKMRFDVECGNILQRVRVDGKRESRTLY